MQHWHQQPLISCVPSFPTFSWSQQVSSVHLCVFEVHYQMADRDLWRGILALRGQSCGISISNLNFAENHSINPTISNYLSTHIYTQT